MNGKVINVRFNLDKEKHRQAWAALQQLRQKKGWSYSESFSEALVAFMASDNARERTEEEIARECAERIITMTEQMLKLALPAFISSLTVQGGTAALARAPTPGDDSEVPAKDVGTDTIPDDEIPWDYLGE